MYRIEEMKRWEVKKQNSKLILRSNKIQTLYQSRIQQYGKKKVATKNSKV